MPEIVSWQRFFIQPHRACCGLAHFGAIGGGQQRRGRAVHLGTVHSPGQFDTVDDIAPLIRTAHLEAAAISLREFPEIVGLQNHVVEFEEAERLFAVQALFDGIKTEHPIDGEVLAYLAQEGDIFQAIQPLRIVHHDGIGRAISERQETVEDLADRRDVFRDELSGHELAGFILEARIANLSRATAHHDDRLMSGLLKAAQQHDLHHAADMQRRRRGIETDIAGHHLLLRKRIERGGVG